MSAATLATAAQQAPEVIKYYLKFAINIPYSDVQRMLQTDTRLLYGLKDCSRAGKVDWKLKLYRHKSGEDEFLAVYLKFEPQVCTAGVSCTTEFSVRISGPEGRSLERQSSSTRQFSKADDSWGWSQFARTSELEAFVSSTEESSTEENSNILKLSGVIKIFESSRLLYPHRRHNFTRPQNGADFKMRVGQVTFHVHRAMLALNSDHFAAMFTRTESEEARAGLVTLREEKVQDIHLMLQFMYPGYSRVLEESSLMALSKLAARYTVHSLAWSCMQYVDTRLSQQVEPEKAMKYYFICIKYLRCSDLAEQCVRSASEHQWHRIKESAHFKLLDESEKAAFLEAYLDFKEERQRTPLPTQLPADRGGPTINGFGPHNGNRAESHDEDDEDNGNLEDGEAGEAGQAEDETKIKSSSG